MKNGIRVFVVAAVIGIFANRIDAATTNTWDADTGTTGAQDGSGTWTASASDTNWWNNSAANTNWSNSTAPDLTIIGAGSGAAGTITLGEAITVGHLRFNAAGSGSYTLDGNGNLLGFGFDYPLLWVTSGVTVTNRANSSSTATHLNISGGGTFVFAGTNTFASVDMMDAQTAWYGITGGVAGTTITIPSGASLRTTGYPPVYQYSTFGFRLRDGATLNVDGNLTTSARIGGHSGEDNYNININPGAVVTNTSDVMLGWNSIGTLSMNGGYMIATSITHLDSATGTLNLNGGTLEVNQVTSSTGPGAFLVNFNGGLLRARADTLLTEVSTKSAVATYLVKNGGALIDINGKNVETIVPFSKSGSGGLTRLGTGTMTFAGGSYTGATTVAAGTLNLNFNKRASWVARDTVSDFYDRTSRLVLNGGNFVVTGRAAVPSVTKSFTVGVSGYERCARSGNTAGLVAGMPVSGLHIPTNTYVAYVNNSTMLIMSKAATNGVAGTVSLTFGAVTNTTWQTIDKVELQQDATVTVDSNGGPGTTLAVGTITGVGGLTKDGNGTLALLGTNTYGGATLIKGGTVKLAAFVTVTNASFEMHETLASNPVYGVYGTPTNAFWTFYSAGIAAQGSTWVGSTAAIDGNDACFIQANGVEGRVSTTLVTPADGLYVISFMAGKRPTTAATAITVEIDGTNQFTFASTDFNVLGDIYTGSAVLSSGTHTLTFRGNLTAGVDASTWIDRVSVTTLAGGGLVGSLPTGTVAIVASGTVLDLSGKAQLLAGLSGVGLVTNGTLAVSGMIVPGGTNVIGKLTVAADTTLSGTLLIDASLGGTNDLLKVQGTLNLTGSTLQIQDVDQLKSGTSYVIATCTPGGLTGRFASANVAVKKPWHVVYDNGAGEVRLEIIGGTLLRIN